MNQRVKDNRQKAAEEKIGADADQDQNQNRGLHKIHMPIKRQVKYIQSQIISRSDANHTRDAANPSDLRQLLLFPGRVQDFDQLAAADHPVIFQAQQKNNEGQDQEQQANRLGGNIKRDLGIQNHRFAQQHKKQFGKQQAQRQAGDDGRSPQQDAFQGKDRTDLAAGNAHQHIGADFFVAQLVKEVIGMGHKRQHGQKQDDAAQGTGRPGKNGLFTKDLQVRVKVDRQKIIINGRGQNEDGKVKPVELQVVLKEHPGELKGVHSSHPPTRPPY